MKRTSAIGLLAAMMLNLAACGGDGTAVVIPEDRLDAALLTRDDFDKEWTEAMRGVFTSRREGPQSLDPTGWCPRAQQEVDELADIEKLAGETGAAVEFRHERKDVRRMFHGISQQVWSNDDVSAYFDVLTEAFGLCNNETWSPEPDQEVTISKLESPGLGDESLSLYISIVTPGPDGAYVWASRMVVVVIESSLMILRDLDVQLEGGEPFMTDAEWNDLVGVAMERFTDVVGTSSAKGGFLATDPFFADIPPAISIG